MDVSSSSVGIDTINIYAGPLKLDLAELAAARDFSEQQLSQTGFLAKSVASPYEDPVTFAVNAAKPILNNYDKNDFELLIVATESAVDFGKPISSYVHRFLNLPERCRNFEVKHACYSGTAALQMAKSWVQCQPTKKALVIMSDFSRRHFLEDQQGVIQGNLAELTGGTAAVAMVVSAEPKMLAFDGYTGCASMEVFDVARPNITHEWADPVLSLHAFLDMFDVTWDFYKKNNTSYIPGQMSIEYLG